MTAKCICTGPVCSCGAEGIVKDGASVRTSAMMMDSAGGADNGQDSYERRIADGWKRTEEARSQMIADMAVAYRGDTGTSRVSVADSIKNDADHAYAQAFADAKAAGMDDDAARNEASYQAMCSRTSNAWKT